MLKFECFNFCPDEGLQMCSCSEFLDKKTQKACLGRVELKLFSSNITTTITHYVTVNK